MHSTVTRRPEDDSDPVVPESLRRLACLSLSHEAVPDERVGTVAPEDPSTLAREVKTTDRLTGCVVLSTCNRVEVYTSSRTASPEDIETAIVGANEALGAPAGLQTYIGLDVAWHLARVACGIESAVLGEDQILGQVNRAFENARRKDLAGGVLSRVGDAAVRIGRTCRAETSINDGEAGYGGAICRHLERHVGHPPDRVLIVGAGELATVAASAIDRRWETRIDVANRSPAADVASNGGTLWPLNDLASVLPSVDAVVTATGAADPVLSRDQAACCAPGTLVIDLANPPDVSEAARACANIDVVGLADIGTALEARTESRTEAVPVVEALIEDAIQRLVRQERENRAEETLRALHRRVKRTRERELERARARLEDGEADVDAVLTDFARALTGQLVAEPTQAIREAAREGDTETVMAAQQLFDLSEVPDSDSE